MEIVSIQFAAAGDAASIAVFSRQAFLDTFAPYNTKENMDKFLTDQFSVDMLINEFQMDGNIFLIARVGEELAGYAFMRETENPRNLATVPPSKS